MAYRLNPKIKEAAQWHAMLNNGMHIAAVDAAGNILATGRTAAAHAIRIAIGVNPRLRLIRIDEQI